MEPFHSPEVNDTGRFSKRWGVLRLTLQGAGRETRGWRGRRIGSGVAEDYVTRVNVTCDWAG